jgi:hypothetical protein
VATILGEVGRPACAPRNHRAEEADVAAGADNFQRHPAADLARNQPRADLISASFDHVFDAAADGWTRMIGDARRRPDARRTEGLH